MEKDIALSVMRFVIHEHHARQLHYDFRLEIGDVLKSWAISDYDREQIQTDMRHPKIRRGKMRYEPFDLPTYYVLGQHGYTVRPQQGTGLVITILFEHTEDGTGIAKEELLNEARNSSIGQRLIAEKKCNLTPGHRSNRVNVTLGYFRSKKVFPDKPAVELKSGKLFLTKV